MEQLQEVRNWLLQHTRPATASKSDAQSSSFIVLFDGGLKQEKLHNAELLAREAKKELYRVDVSTIVSKYIDETEKNLSAVFKKAGSKRCILFFDEADALFGKRTKVRDSHDRYANQEVSYLLQRLEEYPGLIIISVNSKETLSEPFVRRLRYVVSFK